jgi:Tfp pilus assembly protein PilV
MRVRFHKRGDLDFQIACAAMTLPEVLISIVILVTIMGAIINGYVQANRLAEFSSMSLAAQSTALQGVEQAVAARWDTQSADTNTGPGHADELGCTNNWTPSGTNVLDIPVSGAAIPVINYVTITTVTNALNPVRLRQIRSDAIWTFPLTGVTYTNTVVTLRAPDQ